MIFKIKKEELKKLKTLLLKQGYIIKDIKKIYDIRFLDYKNLFLLDKNKQRIKTSKIILITNQIKNYSNKLERLLFFFFLFYANKNKKIETFFLENQKKQKNKVINYRFADAYTNSCQSCMTGKDVEDFYDAVGARVMFGDSYRLLLWEVKKNVFLDRLYMTEEFPRKNIFIIYLYLLKIYKRKNIFIRFYNSYNNKTLFFDLRNLKVINKKIKIEIYEENLQDIEFYPYLDTMSYYDYRNEVLQNFKPSHSSYTTFDNTDGTDDENYFNNGKKCCNCECYYSEDEGYYDDDGNFWCEDCFNENFAYCYGCDSLINIYIDTYFLLNDDIYCDKCITACNL